MKQAVRLNLTFALAGLALSIFNSQLSTGFAQGTAFTYQGQLQNNGSPASGTYNLQFTLYTNATGGTASAGPVTNSAVAVANGLFTVTIDFGAGPWNGQSNWLQIAVETNAAGATFTNLSPRQPLTPVPYAITAGNVSGTIGSASLAGAYGSAVSLNNANNALTGSFTGNGANVTNVNAATLGGLTAPNFWQTGGNAGTTPGVNFIGTTDNQPLEFKVNNQQALRLEAATNFIDQSINVIAGYSGNFVAAGTVGATIGGGGGSNGGSVFSNTVTGDFATVGGGDDNAATADQATVAGGFGNAAAEGSMVGGGDFNNASGNSATVAGGVDNTASGFAAFIGGGGDNGLPSGNTASGTCSVVAGGLGNQAANNYATVPGGANNVAGGEYSFAAGQQAQALNQGSFVWADSQNDVFASINDDSFNVRAQGGAYFVTGGTGMTIDNQRVLTTSSSISPIQLPGGLGGSGNTVSGSDATVAGGYENAATNLYATVGGGPNNTAGGYAAAVPGGDNNVATGTAAIASGDHTTASGEYSFAAGHDAQATNDGAFVWADSQNTVFASTTNDSFNVRAQGGVRFVTSGAGMSIDGQPVLTSGAGLTIQSNAISPNVILGYSGNSVAGGVYGATIGGGGANFASNSVSGDFGTVNGGEANQVTGNYGTVSGGQDNIAGVNATVGGGSGDLASGSGAFVGGGGYDGSTFSGNTASGNASVVAGGLGNQATASYATVGGGFENQAANIDATVDGGYENIVTGFGAMVAGGANNLATNETATVCGGQGNVAGGYCSFAAGLEAKALNDGSFVWADDSSSSAFASTATNQFLIRAGGGVGINTTSPGSALQVNGTVTIAGQTGSFPKALEIQASSGGTSRRAELDLGNWGLLQDINGNGTEDFGIYDYNANTQRLYIATTGHVGIGTTSPTNTLDVNGNLDARGNVYANGVLLTSDRNAKKNFAPVNPEAVLAKVASLPITEWNYKTDGADQKHLGPMAQDFHAAFGLDGSDDKHISVIDEGGVALAAIQGLNEQVEGRSQNDENRIRKSEAREQKSEAKIRTLETENAKLQTQVTALQAELAGLQKAVASLTDKSGGRLALNTQREEGR